MAVVVLVVILAAFVLFGVGAAATGRLPGLADVPADDAGDGLPAGQLSASDLDRARFPLAFRGYRMADVDRVLDRLTGELLAREAEIARLSGHGLDEDAVASPPDGAGGRDDRAPSAATRPPAVTHTAHSARPAQPDPASHARPGSEPSRLDRP